MIQAQTQLGFSITSALKSVAKSPLTLAQKSYGVTKFAAKKTGSVAKTAGKIVYKASVLPLQYTLIKPTEWLANQATRPIKNRVHTLVNRRAAKLAFDKRKSTVPNAAEKAEAKAWAKHKLTYDGPGGIPTPHGKILAMFAGSYVVPSYNYTYAGQLGVAPAVVAAAVPVLIALANAMISKYAKSGEAPANPNADQQANAEDPITPGTVDLQPVQNAIDEAVADANDTGGGDDAGGGGAMSRRSGFPHITRNHMLIGAAVIGGIVVISLLTKSKS